MANKLTNKVVISAVRDFLANMDGHISDEFTNDMFIEKLDKLIETFDKKYSGERKPSRKQIANEKYKTAIMAYLADGEKRTATEIWKNTPELASNEDMTIQRVSQLLRQLKETDFRIDKAPIKGKMMFWAV